MDIPGQNRYFTVAAEFYRNKLKEELLEVQGFVIEKEPPTKEKGQKVVEADSKSSTDPTYIDVMADISMFPMMPLGVMPGMSGTAIVDQNQLVELKEVFEYGYEGAKQLGSEIKSTLSTTVAQGRSFQDYHIVKEGVKQDLVKAKDIVSSGFFTVSSYFQTSWTGNKNNQTSSSSRLVGNNINTETTTEPIVEEPSKTGFITNPYAVINSTKKESNPKTVESAI